MQLVWNMKLPGSDDADFVAIARNRFLVIKFINDHALVNTTIEKTSAPTLCIRFGGGVRPFDHRQRRRADRSSPASIASCLDSMIDA
jgi:hypothetical protein